jgi:hypothetical protein
VDNFIAGEITACPHETSFHVRFDCAAIQPHDVEVSFSGRAVIAGKRIITEFWGGGITYEAVGLIALCAMGRRKSGRAYYAPLWRCGGGGGRTPPWTEKNANVRVCVFFFRSVPGYGRGLSLPL